jgi:hypothetical protein
MVSSNPAVTGGQAQDESRFGREDRQGETDGFKDLGTDVDIEMSHCMESGTSNDKKVGVILPYVRGSSDSISVKLDGQPAPIKTSAIVSICQFCRRCSQATIMFDQGFLHFRSVPHVAAYIKPLTNPGYADAIL